MSFNVDTLLATKFKNSLRINGCSMSRKDHNHKLAAFIVLLLICNLAKNLFQLLYELFFLLLLATCRQAIKIL